MPPVRHGCGSDSGTVAVHLRIYGGGFETRLPTSRPLVDEIEGAVRF